ncbi:MAG: ferredoxin-type protein NapF [Marivibrio sp.]|uniref:ferredoxin-type protein NapF n=1 Tax=Marivibrio sp. TaxID=2039719 RepID=UPI0032F03CD5
MSADASPKPADAPVDHGRRALLRGRPAGPPPVRPPWTDEARLADACTRCGACLSACPEDILVAGSGGLPAVDFHAGGGECIFCHACVDACPEPVFEAERDPPWRLSVTIAQDRCLPHAGVHCEACRDACPEGAIRFAPRLGGPPTPEILPERCTGCGACVGVCPEEAVAIAPARREAPA